VYETIVREPHHSFDKIRVVFLNLAAQKVATCLDRIVECEDLVAKNGHAF
jgi:hypothetical protein